MPIEVVLGRDVVQIDDSVFTTLLDNSVAGTYKGYENALAQGRIKFTDLVDLSRKGNIPYSLFFAPLPLVQEQVRKKTDKLLAGISRKTFSIGSRATVELRDVELIVKDLIRKQQLLRKHDPSLRLNDLVGILRDEGASIESDSSRLMSAIALTRDDLRDCATKADALQLLIERLEAKQVLVSRSVQHYMPQRLTHVKFSGMTVRDSKVPYVFLAGGDHGDDQEPTGRTIFTLALMTVLIARRIFAPMTWDGGRADTEPGREYDIAGAMLMPKARMTEIRPTTLSDMKSASDEFKVTPSAVTVRAMRLGIITAESARSLLGDLHLEYSAAPKGGPRSSIRPENAVRKYNGRELTVRMLRALDAGTISRGDFCRAVCLNHLDSSEIDNLRRAVT